jgi:Uma2 family endonuclease
MTVQEVLHSDFRTTVEAFHAFTDDRPDFERWELIDGEMFLNPTPTNRHQIIVSNILVELDASRERLGASWLGMPGIGTRHPDDRHNEPVPDVVIVPTPATVSNWTFEILVAFEVLSPDSIRRDMVRKRNFYERIASLTHYVVLAQDRREPTVFPRADAFSPSVYAGDDSIKLAALGIDLPLARLYRNVPMG